MVGYHANFMQLRLDRQKGVVDTLYQVERSHIPFPDEPPIVYPDAEIWQQLTARRKEKYSSMDLAKRDEILPSLRQADEWDLVIVDEAHRMSARKICRPVRVPRIAGGRCELPGSV